MALGASCAAARAQVDQHAEERFDEARANPTPIGGKGNWVVVPIPVANPTIGNGLQLAALYLHPKKPGEENAPGATSGLVAIGTDKGTRVFGGFHDGGSHSQPPADPALPWLRVTGAAVFGGVDVTTRATSKRRSRR